MHVELIGCTSVGKSTLAAAMADAARAEGVALVHGSELALGLLGLSGSSNRLVRPLAIHAVAALGCSIYGRQHLSLIRFSRHLLQGMPIPRWQRWNQLRKVLKQFGCFEVTRRRDETERVVLVDEGPVHAAHNLFVHVAGTLNPRDVERFAELVPLPDVVVCMSNAEEVLVQRTLQRGHPRIPASASQESVAKFVRDALTTFEVVSRHERIASRTILLDDCGVTPPRNQEDNPHIQTIARILRRSLQSREPIPERRALATPAVSKESWS